MRLLLKDLQPGQTYALQARSKIDGEVSDWSNKTDFITDIDAIQPNTPTNVTWVSSGDSFQAEWDTVTTNEESVTIQVVRYEVELNSGTDIVIKSVPQATGSRVSWNLSFSENLALFGSAEPAIDMRVRAVDNKDLKSDWSSVLSANNPPPGPPTSPVATGIMNGIDLVWEAPVEDDLIGYNVYVGTTVGFVPTPSNRVWSGNATRFFYATTTYVLTYLKIRAVDKFNQESFEATASATPQSPFILDTIPPAVPTGLTAAITTNASAGYTYMDIAWNANAETDLAGYKIKHRKTGDTVWTTLDVTRDAVNVRVQNLVPYVNYDVVIAAYDESNNVSGYTATVVAVGASNSAPSTPEVPGAASNTLQIQVTPTGNKAAGGAMEADVAFYEVYASITTGFTPGTGNQIGVIPVGPAMSVTFPIPAAGGGATQTWFVKVIAVDNGGLKSTASAQATSTPTLIAGVNIVDATITNAKISDLAADKITAGSGIINSLIVKSTLTLGDASTNGILQSFDYVASTTGFKLQKNNLEINSGTILAAAIKLQVGTNISTPTYSNFEATSRYYPVSWPVNSGTSFTAALDAAQAKYGTRSLKIVNTSAAARQVFMGSTTTNYNIPAEPSTRYILSMWIWNAGASVNGFGFIKQQDAATASGGLSAITATAAWTRYSWVVTTTSSATSILLALQVQNDCTLYIDGIQLERSVNATNTAPSPYTFPAHTTIDGGQIRTGSIESTLVGTVWDETTGGYITDPAAQPAWLINTAGDAKFGNLLVTGSVVVGTATPPSGQLPTIAAGNYVPGSAGWMIRADGYSEFRQMAVNSIHADAIILGTLTANMIASGVINSNISITGILRTGDFAGSALSVSNKALTSNIVTLTTSTAHEFAIGDNVLVSGVGSPFNGTFTIIGTPTDVTFEYDLVNADIASSAASGSVVKVVTNRSVVIDSTGVNLIEADGTSIAVSLPTDSGLPASFSGVINATSLNVSDNFILQGEGSVVTAGSTFTLAASITPPASAPTIAKNYTNFSTWIEPSSFSNGFFGLGYDGVQYITANMFFGAQAFCYGPTAGDFVANVGMAGAAFTISPYGGITKLGGNWFMLGWNGTTSQWMVTKYANSGSGFDTISDQWVYNRATDFGVTTSQWKGPAAGFSGLKYPTIGNDGTSILIARCNLAGTIKISTFAVGGTHTATITTNVTDNQDLRSVLYGAFDFGGSRFVVTTHGTGTSTAKNYVFGAGGAQQSLQTWPSPSNVKVAGLAWDGTAFNTFADGGTHYQYTSVGNNQSLAWNIKSTWYDSDATTVSVANRELTSNVAILTVGSGHNFFSGDSIVISGYTSGDTLFNGSYVLTTVTSTTISYAKVNTNVTSGAGSGTPVAGTITHETVQSTAVPVTITRRSRVNITSGSIPDKGRRNDPDSVRFYISTNGSGGTYYRQAALGAGVKTLVLTSAPATGTTGTDTIFPAGTPARIISSNALLELSAAGTGLFGSVTDPSTTAGNTPALRIGNIAGQHLRMGRREILAMDDDDSQGELQLNAGGDIQLGSSASLVRVLGTFQTGGKDVVKWNWGTESGTTDSGGDLTFAHGLGGTPTVALAVVGTGASTMRCSVTGFGSTNITVEFRNSSTNAVINGGSVSCRWFAIR